MTIALIVVCHGACLIKVFEMKFFFLHNHFIPQEIKKSSFQIESVIVPEFYPDRNLIYLDDPIYFTSVEAYIDYVVRHRYYPESTVFAIENNRIIDPNMLQKTLTVYRKLGVKIIQLFCGYDNVFFTQQFGLTRSGRHLLSEMCELGLILDLSHLDDDQALKIAGFYPGKMIVSHCACSDLYALQKPRSNSLKSSTLYKLADHVDVFGVAFLNDIVASQENELCSDQIFKDIIAQIVALTDIVGVDKVALGSDYIDIDYFSKIFNTKLMFPEILLKPEGLYAINERLKSFLSNSDRRQIFFGNVARFLGS